jgi:CheY-like chemotaxis protein
MSALAGKRILIVEDEFLIAAAAAEMLAEAGAITVGPAGAVAEALSLAKNEQIDAALLDVNLQGERSDAVAEALRAAGVPFVIATGYGSGSRGRASDVPVIDKPYSQQQLTEALIRALGG